MFGIELDALDPTLVAIGIVIGAVSTYLAMRHADKRSIIK